MTNDRSGSLVLTNIILFTQSRPRRLYSFSRINIVNLPAIWRDGSSLSKKVEREEVYQSSLIHLHLPLSLVVDQARDGQMMD